MAQRESDYRPTVRLPRIYRDFLVELAYRKRSTVNDIITDLIKDEIDRYPDIFQEVEAAAERGNGTSRQEVEGDV